MLRERSQTKKRPPVCDSSYTKCQNRPIQRQWISGGLGPGVWGFFLGWWERSKMFWWLHHPVSKNHWAVTSNGWILYELYIVILEHTRRRGTGERESQAGSTLSTEPDARLDPLTLGSWPEPKSRVKTLAQLTESPRRPYMSYVLIYIFKISQYIVSYIHVHIHINTTI